MTFRCCWIALVILCLGSPTEIIAQNNHFDARLKLGISTSQIDGDGYGGFNKVGVAGGIGISRQLSDLKSISFDILWVQKGSVDPANANIGKFSIYKIKTNYIDIPVTYTYLYKKVGLEGGLSANVFINSSESNGISKVPNTFTFNRFELAFIAGLSHKLNDKLIVSGRYSRAISPSSGYFIKTNFGLFGGSYNEVVYITLNYNLSQ